MLLYPFTVVNGINADILEGVKNMSGDPNATAQERYNAARERERLATYRRRHLIVLHREKQC